MPSAADILATFPEFDSADAGDVSLYLELAEAEQADLWGDVRYQKAIALRAAYMMVGAGLGTGGASSGDVASESIGSLSVSYATGGSSSSGSGSALSSTPYGEQLEQMINEAVIGVRTSYDG